MLGLASSSLPPTSLQLQFPPLISNLSRRYDGVFSLPYTLKLCGYCIYRLWAWNNGKLVGWHLPGLWHIIFSLLALFIFYVNVMTTTRHILQYSQPTFLPTSTSLHIWVSCHQLLLLLCCLTSIILSCINSLIHCFNSPYFHDPVP